MRAEEILEELRSAMASLFELEPGDIRRESRLFEDLDLDSIDAIDLIIKMQELTGEKIDQASMQEVRTVGDIADLVEALTSGRTT